jgi:Arc/MetJ family transcription regulator
MCILMHINTYIFAYHWSGGMRTTLNIEDELLARAAELTGIKEKTSLVRLGLEALIARESAKRLAALGGTEKELEMIPRRRTEEPAHGSG